MEVPVEVAKVVHQGSDPPMTKIVFVLFIVEHKSAKKNVLHIQYRGIND